MTNHRLAPAHHVKERLSSVIMVPAPHAVDDRWRRWSRDWPVRELAPAPAGSGLKAVRGMPTALRGSHARLHPIRLGFQSRALRPSGFGVVDGRVRHQDGGHRRP